MDNLTRITTALAEIKALCDRIQTAKATHSMACEWPEGCSCGARDYNHKNEQLTASRETIKRLVNALEHEIETSRQAFWKDETELWFTKRRAELAAILTGVKP